MCTANTETTTGPLPPLTLEQVRQKLVAFLSHAGDLGSYIERVDEGIITIKDLSIRHPSGCSTQPKPTVIGKAAPQELLERVHDAIASVNEDFEQGRPLRLVLSRAQPACIDVNGREIPPPAPPL